MMKVPTQREITQANVELSSNEKREIVSLYSHYIYFRMIYSFLHYFCHVNLLYTQIFNTLDANVSKQYNNEVLVKHASMYYSNTQ